MIASGSSDLELAAQFCGTTSPHIDLKEIAEYWSLVYHRKIIQLAENIL